MSECIPEFNGERVDPVCRTIHSGNGYRDYNPVLMRFHRPDSLSPFSAGGINPYGYCLGDPVNFSDPSGHMSWQAGLGIGLGIAGVVAALFTAGTSLVAAGSLSAALAATSATSLVAGSSALIADATGLASVALQDRRPQTAAALGWASLATGALSMGIGLAAGGYRFLNRITAGLQGKMVSMNGRIGIPLSGEFRNARFIGAYHVAGRVTWNLRFEDTVPLGRRLTVVMASVTDSSRVRVVNEEWVNDRWVRELFGPTALKHIVQRQEEQAAIYRLVIPNSATHYQTGGQNIAMEFRNAFRAPRPPVIAYRGMPEWRGPVVGELKHAYGLAENMEREGVAWGPHSAQHVLDALSAEFAHVEGAISFQGPHVVYPLTTRFYTDPRIWL